MQPDQTTTELRASLAQIERLLAQISAPPLLLDGWASLCAAEYSTAVCRFDALISQATGAMRAAVEGLAG